ncbi:MAG: YIP1 family protein [bacterium]|nr:YIP1 family protein [bacterium]
MEKIRWQKMAEDTKKFFTSPIEFYQNFEKEGTLLEPILYVILMTLFGELILIIFYGLFDLKVLHLNLLIYILFIPMIVLSFLISTLILHFIWVLLGSNENFITSLRCNASFSPIFPVSILISFIPFFGKWIGFFIWFFILWFYIVLASIYVHNIEEEKAKKVFLIIFLVISIFRFVNLVRWEIKEKIARRKAEEISKKIEENMKKWEEYQRQILEQQRKILEQQQQSPTTQ